jgi:hypothetical protein
LVMDHCIDHGSGRFFWQDIESPYAGCAAGKA